MRWMWLGCGLASIIFLGACVRQTRVLDITELTPPSNVTAVVEGDRVVVRWQPSLDESEPDFAGYNLYIATYSLMTTAFAQDDRLPPPIVLGKEHEKVLEDLEPGKRYFIQVRSRLENGRLSVASLPEVEVVVSPPENP